MLSKHEAWQIPLSNFLHDTSQRQYCICKDAVEKSWIHWKNTKAHVRKKKTKLKELVGSAQDAIFCHKSEVSITENKLGKEVNLCWCLTGLVSELNAWWQGNQEITRISDLVCSATGTGLLKRKNPTQWLFFFLLQGRMLQTNVSQLNFLCGQVQQIAPAGRIQSGILYASSCTQLGQSYLRTWKSVSYQDFVYLWELRSLYVMKS